MKKILPALALILLLICSAALGEGTLAAPFPGDSPEAILAARIGEVLNMTYTPETPEASLNSEARAAAANRMLAGIYHRRSAYCHGTGVQSGPHSPVSGYEPVRCG